MEWAWLPYRHIEQQDHADIGPKRTTLKIIQTLIFVVPSTEHKVHYCVRKIPVLYHINSIQVD